LTRRPVGSGPSVPDPTAARACERPDGCGHAGAGGGGTGGRRRWPKVAPGHDFMRGLHLCEASVAAKPTVRLHEKLRRRPRHDVHGGGRSPVGKRRRGVRPGRKEKEGGVCFITTRWSLGGRKDGEGVDGGGDRRRQPYFNVGGGELEWAHERWRGRWGSSVWVKGGRGRLWGA
jgi:hypothetical protein